MDSDKAYKEQIGTRLTKKIAQGLENEEIDENQASEMATYILDNIDSANTSTELFSFIEDLANKWSFFEGVLKKEQGDLNKKKEDIALQEASQHLKQNDIEGAIGSAKKGGSQ